jgi:hypothetical protein
MNELYMNGLTCARYIIQYYTYLYVCINCSRSKYFTSYELFNVHTNSLYQLFFQAIGYANFKIDTFILFSSIFELLDIGNVPVGDRSTSNNLINDGFVQK